MAPMEAFAEPMKAACKEKDIEFKGYFDCQGSLAESMHAGQKAEKSDASDKELTSWVAGLIMLA